MFYLGEYDEDEAIDIRTFLSDAGIRVELKPYLVMDSDEISCLHGKHSRLKELIADMSDFERYLSAMKSAISQSSTKEEFDELFLRELDPEMMKKRDEILALCQRAESQSQKETSEEAATEGESPSFSSEEWLRSMLESGKAQSFAQSVLSLNEIKIGEPLGNKLDDPLLEVPVDPEDYDPEPDELKLKLEFHLCKSFGLYVDEFTTPMAGEIDEEFTDLYPDEYQQISALGMLIEKLATPPSARKMSLEEFYDGCVLRKDDGDVSLMVDGKEVYMDLIRVLEKADVLKSKGDRVKWRS